METPEQRRAGLGSSEVAAAVGLSRWRTPLDVWMEKRGLTEPVTENPWMTMGKELEPLVARLYAEDQGVAVLEPERWVAHPEHPWARASADRLHTSEAGRMGVEIKTMRRWPPDYGEPGTDQVPVEHLVQCAWCMWVLDFPAWRVAAFSEMEMRVYELQRSPSLEAVLVEKAQAFWQMVQDGVAPEADAKDGGLLAKLHPHGGERAMVAATPELNYSAELLQQVREEQKALQERRALLENDIKQAIGGHDGIEGDAWRATWRPDKNGNRIFRFKRSGE